MDRIKVLKVEPLAKPELIEIDNDYHVLRDIVGGTLQFVYPWSDRVAVIIDDCGKIKGYLPNRVLKADNGKPCDILFGTFLITGLTEEDIGSLSNDLAKKYSEKFRWPEYFLKSDAGNLIVMKPGSKESPTILASCT